MTVYARSDIASVTLSDAHGGCGNVHTRPAPGGKPVAVWELTCQWCEDTLRKDPLWSPTATTIPETPDEVAARENHEKKTARQQQERNVEAMEKLGEMPDALRSIGPDLARALIAALTPLLSANQTVTAPPVPEDSPAPPAAPVEPQDAAPGGESGETPGDNTLYENMSLKELKAVAAEMGIQPKRSREDQLAAILEHLEA